MLWLCTWGGGINRFSPETETFIHYRHQTSYPNSLASDYCRYIYEDKANNLWITCFDGLDSFDREKNIFRHYHESTPAHPDSVEWAPSFFPAFEDDKDFIWIIKQGPLVQSIERHHPKADEIFRYREDYNDPNTVKVSHYRSIFQDHSGNFWMGCDFRGVTKFNPLIQYFQHYYYDSGNTTSLSHNMVFSIVESKIHPGTIWVGTREGLNQFNPDTKSFSQFYHHPKNSNSLSHNYVMSLFADKSGLLWIGTKGGDLDCYDERTKQSVHYDYSPDYVNRSSIFTLFRDHQGILWISEITRGLIRFNRENFNWTRFQPNPLDSSALSYRQVTSIVEDKNGVLWIGTFRGLNRFNAKEQNFAHYHLDKQIETLYIDSKDRFWIGTLLSGFGLFDPESGRAQFYAHATG